LDKREKALKRNGMIFVSTLSNEDAEWFAGGIEKYLAGNCTVDRALGMSPKGRPPGTGELKHHDLAYEAAIIQMGRGRNGDRHPTWAETASLLIERGNIDDIDPSDLQKICERYHEQTVHRLSEELAQRLKSI
jgi:hypothetical protein